MAHLEGGTSGDVTGLRRQAGEAAAVLSRPARARGAPRVPPRPWRAVLAGGNFPERAAQSPLNSWHWARTGTSSHRPGRDRLVMPPVALRRLYTRPVRHRPAPPG